MKTNLFKLRLNSQLLSVCLLAACFFSSYVEIKAGESQIIDVVQQKKSVKGIVLDQLGNPIIGASVLEDGTSNGTITDMEGKFVLEISPKSKLNVSFLGYKDVVETPIFSKLMEIVLKEDLKVLDEVVVVGFGTQKKVNLTGAVGVVDAKEISSRPVMNTAQALQGLSPGLQISQNMGGLDSRPNIKIRGTATIGEGSSGSPLVLIDGMEGDINSINPQDIENISVLKDAAASSIYGSRAPFGVILITTKKGKKGKPKLNYNNSFRWNTPIILPKIVDSYTFATYFNDASVNAGNSPQFGTEQMQRIKDYQDGKLTASVIADPGNPNVWGNSYYHGNDNVDWYDVIFRNTSFSHEHNLSLNGGNEIANYYLSMNYLDQDGLLELNQENYKRYTGTAKINVKMSKWAYLNYTSRFSREDSGRPAFLSNDLFYNLARQAWPTLPLYDPNGHMYASNALNLRDGGELTRQTDRLNQQIQLVLEPIVNWKTFVEFNYRCMNSNDHRDVQKTYIYDVNSNPIPYNNNSSVYEMNEKENFSNFNIYTEYAKSGVKGHNLKGTLGFQSELMKYKTFSAQSQGIIVSGLPVLDLTSGLDSNGKAVSPGVSGRLDHWATAGFFGRLNYNYKERYLFELNLRYDGTSRFRKDNRWKLFPSFSLGWNIAKENFWKDFSEYISTFKIRASYGELGNQNTGNWYPTYQIMNVQMSKGDWLMNGVRPNVSYSPSLISTSLTWERVKTWNIGFDINSLNNRLTASFDLYSRKTLDMVGPAPELPVTLGTGVPSINNTDLRTYGWELSLGWNDVMNCGLGYGVKLLMSDSQTEVTNYPNETGRLDKKRTGCMLGEIWGYETKGIARNEEEMDNHLASLPNGGQDALGNKWGAGDIMYVDLNNDGRIDNGSNTLDDHGDLKIIGNDSPRYLFGLDLDVNFKGFDFRAFFQGVLKRDYFQDSYYFWGAKPNMWEATCMEEHLDYFRDDPDHILGLNLDSYYPRPIFGTGKNQYCQSKYIQNAAYIRLKNLQFGYTLPVYISKKFNVAKLRLFFSGENLWTGTGMIGNFDPETIDGGWKGSAYPLFRTYSFGLNINF